MEGMTSLGAEMIRSFFVAQLAMLSVVPFLLAADAPPFKYLDAKALQHSFDLQRHLRYVDAIFARVFGEKSASHNA